MYKELQLYVERLIFLIENELQLYLAPIVTLHKIDLMIKF